MERASTLVPTAALPDTTVDLATTVDPRATIHAPPIDHLATLRRDSDHGHAPRSDAAFAFSPRL